MGPILDSTEKVSEIEKSFKKEEQKKLDRKTRQIVNEWDELYNGNPANSNSVQGIVNLSDKLTKMMNDATKKSLKKL